MPRDGVAPLLVVEDVIVGRSGFVLLPAVAREGLYLDEGDVVDIVHDDARDEVRVLGLEADRDPALVRLRVSSSRPIGAGFEVWRSREQSHVVLKRPPRGPDERAVTLSGGTSRRRG
jgi:bifunctional DNA-binding transcriptional regulator/antitoxin component of YhaV-PrlF toxin-antitoxin module